MDTFIFHLEELIEAAEDVSTSELIAALEITKQSLVLACLTADDDDEGDDE